MNNSIINGQLKLKANYLGFDQKTIKLQDLKLWILKNHKIYCSCYRSSETHWSGKIETLDNKNDIPNYNIRVDNSFEDFNDALIYAVNDAVDTILNRFKIYSIY